MPKVTIREIDKTSGGEVSYLDYTVLVPGMQVEGLTGLWEDANLFKAAFKLAAVKEDADMGIIAAYQLLKQGLSVYYVGIDEFDSIEDLYKEFSDKGKYDLRFITALGFDGNEAYEEAAKYALKCAGDRGDACALLDIPRIETKLSGRAFTKNIDKWAQEKLITTINDPVNRKGVEIENVDEVYGQYGALFTPYINVKIANIDDKDKELYIPASLNYLLCFGKAIKNNAAWYAIAGSVRGVSPLLNIKPEVEFGDSDIEVLQARSVNQEEDAHVAVNVVTNIRPYGQIIWGNRTMLPTTTGLKAGHFLNIRQLCTSIKKELYRAGRQYTFEANSDALWVNFKNEIIPLLNQMKADQGIRGYQIIRNKTNLKALLKATIKIIPIEAVEDFDLTVELTDSIEVNE